MPDEFQKADSPYGPRPTPPPRRDGPSTSGNPYQTPTADSYNPPAKPGYMRLRPHRGNSVLALGLSGVIVMLIGGVMSWLCCIFAFVPPLSLALCIPAWVMGHADLAAIKAGEMDPDGKDITMIGMICGIVGVAILGLGLIMFIGLMIFYVAIVGASAAAQ